jgi:hypothetical protein
MTLLRTAMSCFDVTEPSGVFDFLDVAKAGGA